MFSDQDDIWIENKLDVYLKTAEKIKIKGFLLHSDAILFNKNNKILFSYFHIYSPLITILYH